MSRFNVIHSGRLGFASRNLSNLSRRAHRSEFHAEPLEQRQLLSTGQIVGPVASVNPNHTIGPVALPVTATAPTPIPASTGAQATSIANLPTDNSSSTNTPGVSPMVPATLDVATDDSASVTTSPFSAISALIPEMSGFVSFNGGPVFLVPMADSSITELAIETPEGQPTNSPLTPQFNTLPVILHPINVPTSFQANPTPAVLANQPSPVVPPHVGQSLETELQKPLKLELGPDPDHPPMIDVVEPFQPFEPSESGKAGQVMPDQPKAEQPGTEQPKNAPAPDAGRALDQAPPLWWLPVPVPMPIPVAPPAERGAAPAASGADSPQANGGGSDADPAFAALFGVVAAAGSFRLAMGESRRFGMHWLPSRAASSRSARPHVAGR
jgi:hypothetical protein